MGSEKIYSFFTLEINLNFENKKIKTSLAQFKCVTPKKVYYSRQLCKCSTPEAVQMYHSKQNCSNVLL